LKACPDGENGGPWIDKDRFTEIVREDGTRRRVWSREG